MMISTDTKLDHHRQIVINAIRDKGYRFSNKWGNIDICSLESDVIGILYDDKPPTPLFVRMGLCSPSDKERRRFLGTVNIKKYILKVHSLEYQEDALELCRHFERLTEMGWKVEIINGQTHEQLFKETLIKKLVEKLSFFD